MTAIGWTDEAWNPVTGCDRVSPGCAHCYALTLAPRLRAMGNAKYVGARDGDPAFGVTLHPDKLDQPLRWRRPRRVFVNSMSDLFHELVPDEFIARVFDVMAAARQHTFQVLTKRPERMRDFRLAWHEDHPECGPLPNVWLGVSIENRRYVGRADVLRETPAAVRFISAEPLLGPLVYDASGPACPDPECGCTERCWADEVDPVLLPELNLYGISWAHRRRRVRPRPPADADRVGARPSTTRASTPTSRSSRSRTPGRSPAGRGASPDDLWVHEFPRSAVAA